MARGFWSKRRDNLQTASNYMKATDAVSRPMAILMTVLGILIIGGLLFGVFVGTRWAYSRFTDTTPSRVATTNNGSSSASTSTPSTPPSTSSPSTPTETPAVNETTSTSTTAPSTTTADSGTSADLPNTGPGSYLSIFVLSTALFYIVHRRAQLK